MQFAKQEDNNFMLNAGQDYKEHMFIKVNVYSPFSFRKNLSKARHSIYGNLLPGFSTESSRLEEK